MENRGKLEQAQKRSMKLEKLGEASRRFEIGARQGGNSRTTNSRVMDCLGRSKSPKKVRKTDKSENDNDNIIAVIAMTTKLR